MTEQGHSTSRWRSPAALQGGWTHARTRWLAAGAAVVTLLGLQLWPSAVADGVTPVLPTRLPGYSHVNATVEGAPPGPALMAFAHGQGVEFMDSPQAAVLGADGRRYRQVRTAQWASSAQDQGDPGPFLLSPDGSALAVGTTGGTGRLAVVDLVTGEVDRRTVDAGASLQPVAWSADSSAVFVELAGGEVGRAEHPGDGTGKRLVRVDRTPAGLTDGVVLPGTTGRVAALPDGRLLVTQGGGRTELRTADGQTVLREDTGVPTGLHAGAVSPDGTRVAGRTGTSGRAVWVTQLDRDGRALETTSWSTDVHLYGPEVLGWLDAESLLLGSHDNDTWSLRLHLHDLDVTTGRIEEVSVADPGWTGAAITRVSVAGDLLAGAAPTDVAVVDRGRLPKVLGLASWVVLAGLGVGLVRRVRARRAPLAG